MDRDTDPTTARLCRTPCRVPSTNSKPRVPKKFSSDRLFCWRRSTHPNAPQPSFTRAIRSHPDQERVGAWQRDIETAHACASPGQHSACDCSPRCPRLLSCHLPIHQHCFAPSLASTPSTILHFCTPRLCDGLEPLTVCSAPQGVRIVRIVRIVRSANGWLFQSPSSPCVPLAGRKASAHRCERWPGMVRDPSFTI